MPKVFFTLDPLAPRHLSPFVFFHFPLTVYSLLHKFFSNLCKYNYYHSTINNGSHIRKSVNNRHFFLSPMTFIVSFAIICCQFMRVQINTGLRAQGSGKILILATNLPQFALMFLTLRLVPYALRLSLLIHTHVFYLFPSVFNLQSITILYYWYEITYAIHRRINYVNIISFRSKSEIIRVG